MQPVITDDDRALVREYVEANMEDAVSIRHPGGPPTLDPVTLVATARPGTVVYAGKARIRQVSPSGQLAVGEGQIAVSQVGISVPHTVAGVRVDDVLTVTEAVDTGLVGSSWRIVGIDGGGSFSEKTVLSCQSLQPSGHWGGV